MNTALYINDYDSKWPGLLEQCKSEAGREEVRRRQVIKALREECSGMNRNRNRQIGRQTGELMKELVLSNRSKHRNGRDGRT